MKKVLKYVVKVLLIIGALELGIMGVFNYDVIGSLFGGVAMVGARIAFGIIGIAGLLALGCVARGCCEGKDHNSHKKGGHGGGCCR